MIDEEAIGVQTMAPRLNGAMTPWSFIAPTLLNAVDQAVVATDRNGAIIFWNRCAEQLFGWPSEDVLGRRIGDVVSMVDMAAPLVSVRHDGGPHGTPPQEVEVQRRNGTRVLVSVTHVAIYDHRNVRIGLALLVTDVTARKRDEEAWRASEAQLRALSHYLVKTQEEERTRLARELHDHVAQALAAVELSLHALGSSSDRLLQEKHLAQSVRILEQTNQEIRSLAFNLRPPHLDHLGLVPALQDWVKDARRLSIATTTSWRR